jgi:hypothetical protein
MTKKRLIFCGCLVWLAFATYALRKQPEMQTGAALMLATIAVLVLALTAANWWALRSLRKQGLYPAAGEGTDEDVRKLLASGRKVDAIRLYRELHAASLADALREVNQMPLGPP